MSNFKASEVTVIVPVYKVENYIRKCLDSLIQQTLPNWDAILVDDGSPDNSGRICDEYAQKDLRFRVIHKENGGLSSARNAALSLVNGGYVFFLDSDDFLHPEALESLVKIAKETESDIVQCDFVRGTDGIFPKFGQSDILTFDNHTVFTSYAAKIITCGKLYKYSIIGDIRFPIGLINEDDFTTWKFYYNAKKIAVTSAPYYYYTVNPNSTMANQKRKPNLNYFNAYRERIAFFEQNAECDLEAISRVQWMKSLIMLYANSELNRGQKQQIRKIFYKNYSSKSLKAIPIPIGLGIVFKMFRVAPKLTSRIIKSLRGN